MTSVLFQTLQSTGRRFVLVDSLTPNSTSLLGQDLPLVGSTLSGPMAMPDDVLSYFLYYVAPSSISSLCDDSFW